MDQTQKSRTTIFYFEDGSVSEPMTDEQLVEWHNKNKSSHITAFSTTELCTRKEAKKLLRKYNAK